jgi:hypothetical protein
MFLDTRKNDLELSSRIPNPDPDFFPDPGSKRHRIPDPDPQRWPAYTVCKVEVERLVTKVKIQIRSQLKMWNFFHIFGSSNPERFTRRKKSDPDPHQTEPPVVGTLEEAAAVVTAPNLKPPDSPKLGATTLKQNTSIIGDQD